MAVPSDDMLCRFIPGDGNRWSAQYNRPRPPAFKGNNGISVWHIESLLENNTQPEDIRIEGLRGHGQAHHTAGDYLEKAQEAERRKGIPLDTLVEWRPEDRYVSIAWRQWSYAHVQVECSADENAESVRVLFRQLLSKSARHIVAPDRYSQTH